MAFLANKTVNRLNLHYGVAALASGGGGVFFGVFLLNAGLALPVVLCAYALISAGRLCIRPFVLVAAKRTGLRPMVIFGTAALGLQYPLLAQVHGLEPTLVALCVVAAIGEASYSTAFHAYFAQLGDAEHRGHQTGAREALVALAGVVAPLASGWALTTLGPKVAFGATAGVQLLALVPLLGAPDVPVAPEARGLFTGARQGFLLFLADGWIKAGVTVVWQVALFVLLRESFEAFGGAMALAALAAAVAGLALGRHIDAGRGVGAVWLGFVVLAVCILMRFAATTPATAVAANALGALVGCTYFPTLMTGFYNLAERSPCPLRFQVVAESGWDLGRAVGCLIAAGLVALGAPLQAAILPSLGGAVAALILLRRYYATVGGAAAIAGAAP
jgi:DHA1 family inner membrane transport protein